MAILDDLTREVSFRRFYLRWLVACWLPVLGVVAVWTAAWLPGFPWPYVVMHFVTPFELWLLVGVGQWFFMRRYSPHAGRWAVATFLGGVIATFVWVVAANVKLKMSGLLFVLAASTAQRMGVLHDSIVATIVGAVVCGPAGALLPAFFLSKDWHDRRLWLILSGMVSIVAYACLIPMQRHLQELNPEMIVGDSTDVPTYVVTAIVSMMPTHLMLGWLFSSAILGVLIWKFRERRVLEEVPQVFD